MYEQAKRFGRRYPWEQWFARGQFSLRKGREYDCHPHGMLQMIRNVASSPKFRLRVSVAVGERDLITVTVVGRLPGRAGTAVPRAGGK